MFLVCIFVCFVGFVCFLKKKNVLVPTPNYYATMHVNGCDISRSHTVKLLPNPGASTHDLMDYVKAAMQKKLKTLVIHIGTNEIQQEIGTMKMVKKLVKVIKEIDHEKETEIIFSDLIQMEDHDFRGQIEEIIGKLKRYCNSKGYRFVENSNIDEGFLNCSKLYLNIKGTTLLSRNIFNVLKHIWYVSNNDFLLLLFKNYRFAGKSMPR